MEVLIEDLSDGDRDPNHLTLPASLRRAGLHLPRRSSTWPCPISKGLDRGRVETVEAALQRLDLLQQEGAVLMMPEINIRDRSR